MPCYPADLQSPLGHKRIWRMALPIMLRGLIQVVRFPALERAAAGVPR